jgi:hypothetical protein
LTVLDLARRWRVSPDKIRRFITTGQLSAINVASTACGKPRWIVLPDAVAAFEQRRSAAPPRPARRKRKQGTAIDYYPDTPAQAAEAEGVRR